MGISIHALLAESDLPINVMSVSAVQISIHALLAESDSARPDIRPRDAISIHALLAESDRSPPDFRYLDNIISIHALLAESDTWARGSRVTYVEFLSTLSLRRAT